MPKGLRKPLAELEGFSARSAAQRVLVAALPHLHAPRMRRRVRAIDARAAHGAWQREERSALHSLTAVNVRQPNRIAATWNVPAALSHRMPY